MGRPRIATSILEATGALDKNPKRRAARVNEPQAPEGAVPKPSFVKGKAARIWGEYAPQCIAMGTLKPADAHEFGTWCCLAAEHEMAPDRMIAARIKLKLDYAQKFGIAGGGSRAKISVEKPKAEDPAAKYFAQPTFGPGSTLRQ